MPAPAADALGEVALRHEFEFQLAGAVEAVEHLRIGLAREGADDLAHPARLQQCGQAGLAIAGVVVDDGELACALGDERVYQLGRLPGAAEATNHHGGAIGHAGQRLRGA